MHGRLILYWLSYQGPQAFILILQRQMARFIQGTVIWQVFSCVYRELSGSPYFFFWCEECVCSRSCSSPSFQRKDDPGQFYPERGREGPWTWRSQSWALFNRGILFMPHTLLSFSRSVVSDSVRPHRLQHARPPCPSLSPGVCPSSCALHRWCCPAILSSDALSSFSPQSFPASGTLPISHLCASDNQNTGASASVLPLNIQGWFPLRLTDLISLLSKGLWGVFSSIGVWRHQFLGILPSLRSSSHNHTLTHDHSLDYTDSGLLHCRQILYHMSLQTSPRILEWVAYLFSRGIS